MSIQAELPKGHPMRDAWEAYSATDKYANTRNWALNPNHVDGSLWAAFIAGYAAAPPAEAPGEVSIPVSELVALLPGSYYMDPPDGGSVTVLEQLRRMAADATRHRLAAPAAPAPDTAGDSVLVPRKTLEWWRELCDLNPGDIKPRIGHVLAQAPRGPGGREHDR